MWLALLVGALAVLALGAILLARRDFPIAAVLYVGIVAAFVPTCGASCATAGRARATRMHCPQASSTEGSS
jgi:hypothetical protein